MLGELALRDQHLTAPAKSAAPAHGVDVHAEAARRLQQRRTDGKIPALARGHEYDERVPGRHADRRNLRRPAAMTAFAPAARRLSGGGRGRGAGTRTGGRVAKTANPAGT